MPPAVSKFAFYVAKSVPVATGKQETVEEEQTCNESMKHYRIEVNTECVG